MINEDLAVLSERFLSYLEACYKGKLSSSTMRARGIAARKFLLWCASVGVDPAVVDTMEFARYQQFLDRHLAASTVDFYMTVGHVLARWARLGCPERPSRLLAASD